MKTLIKGIVIVFLLINVIAITAWEIVCFVAMLVWIIITKTPKFLINKYGVSGFMAFLFFTPIAFLLILDVFIGAMNDTGNDLEIIKKSVPNEQVISIPEVKADNGESLTFKPDLPSDGRTLTFKPKPIPLKPMLQTVFVRNRPDLFEVLNYAYRKSGYNKDFIMTMAGENGSFAWDRKSNGVGFDGNRAYGFCQMYETYHKDFIFIKGTRTFTEEFKNPYTQMDRCIGIWNDTKRKGNVSTTFQAYPTRHRTLKILKFM